ncbi:hypothetical protein BC832DRAFT_530629 [Gaertneriomyces semiglobifer]|nr:hypothetical protein BC832DRAFT_530629 [Gaertneriomyces semiglobifer]
MTSTVGSRPPPDPVYVLRGHPTDVTAVIFVANNTLLASGDVAGNIIIWSFAIKRPITVWQAHGSGILALQQLCDSRLLSHGRDDQIHIWSLEGVASGGEPEKVYTLPVNALNFCGAAVFEGAATFGEEDKQASTLIAIPNLAESALVSHSAAIGNVPSVRSLGR